MILVEDLIPEIINLEEGKAIGTLNQPMTARELALSIKRLPRRAQAKRKSQLAKASKLQKNLASSMYADLLKLAEDYLDDEGSTTFRQLQRGSEFIIRDTYKKVFDAAISSAKVAMVGDDDVATAEEKRWLKTATNEELRYWKNLLKDLKDRRVSGGRLRQRIRMYADTVRSIYDSARILATPARVLISWVDRGDKKVCPSREYMRSKSPFTKQKLPTVPRAGQTRCLSNCRCRLVIKNVSYDEWEKRDKQLPKKETMLKALADIKKRRRKVKKESMEVYTSIPHFDVARHIL